MDRWVGKTAVVTGASSGIGAAICVGLANAGVNVVGLARRTGPIEELKTQVTGNGTITARRCDVSSADEVATAFRWIGDSFGCVHILVNNAGVLVPGGITDVGNDMISEKDVLAVIDINLKGPVLCARHAVASMRSNDFDGHIVNINSIAGHYVPMSSQFNVYPSTKYGITAFSAGLLNELADHKNKIKVTSVSPGLVATGMDVAGSDLQRTPALRPQDVADAVLYVLSTPPTVNINELTITPVTERSIAGHYVPMSSQFNVYPSTKYGITAFSAGLLNELADHKNKIKVTSVSPGLVATGMDVAGSDLQCTPALRPRDVADAVLYVLSTPPTVNINELTITPVTERRL